jgi:hypothetical protein
MYGVAQERLARAAGGSISVTKPERHRATFDTRKEAEAALSDFRREINRAPL